MTSHGTTGPEALRMTRAGLAGRRRRLHDGRNRTKAVIDLVEGSGPAFVVKDVASRPFWVRVFLGPWQLRREARAYARLAGIEGIPRLIGRVDRRAIALEFVDGRPLQELPRGSLDGVFFDRLAALVEAMHQRGVAHGDLHHGDVIAGAAGRPYVVDFSTSFVAGPGAWWPRRALFDQICRADRRSVAKLRRRYAAGGAPPPPPRPWLLRLAAGLRDRLRGRPPAARRARHAAGPMPLSSHLRK